jgi:hypothetical protein
MQLRAECQELRAKPNGAKIGRGSKPRPLVENPTLDPQLWALNLQKWGKGRLVRSTGLSLKIVGGPCAPDFAL